MSAGQRHRPILCGQLPFHFEATQKMKEKLFYISYIFSNQESAFLQFTLRFVFVTKKKVRFEFILRFCAALSFIINQ